MVKPMRKKCVLAKLRPYQYWDETFGFFLFYLCFSLPRYSLFLAAQLHWISTWVCVCVCVSLHAQKWRCKNFTSHDHHLKRCYCRIREWVVCQGGSNICLELSGRFKNKSSSTWQRSLKSNPVDLPSKLHFMSQWRKRRHHSNHCSLDSYITCSHFLFKRNAAWSRYEALKHHKRWKCPFFPQETARDIYFAYVMYIWDCYPFLSLTTQLPLLQLFTSGPMGGFQTQRVWQSISGRG